MSTWHQRKAGAIKLPADVWTIVTDPPQGMRTLACFTTESQARETLYRWRCNGHGRHSYLVAPTAGAGVIL